MEKFIKEKRKDWKNSFKKKVKESKDIHTSIEKIIAEYIYYSSKIKEVKTRTKRILRTIELQMRDISNTREEINKKDSQKIEILMKKIRKSL
ncbi:MAG: hypothetical protein U9Q06_04815 [Nanoarchaeota archaeon]|nr:hypothetical protein [Nanoarchaeota archaeon]